MTGGCVGDTSIVVVKIRQVLMVTMPPDADDSVIASLQGKVLASMERSQATALILDISAVETLDSFFARTISETAQMVTLMEGAPSLPACSRRWRLRRRSWASP